MKFSREPIVRFALMSDRAQVCANRDAFVRIVNAALILVVLLAMIASDDAFARRGSSGRSARSGHSGRSGHPGHFPRHARVGVFLGAPLFAPLYYPPSGYYYNPSLPSGPTVYIEQEPVPAEAAPEPSYWYYCRESGTYFPYVGDCAGGWQQVVPEAAPPS